MSAIWFIAGFVAGVVSGTFCLALVQAGHRNMADEIDDTDERSI